MKSKVTEPKKILIIRTDRLGDVVLSTPVITNIRVKYPGAYIAFMCSPCTRDVLAANPCLDEIIVYDKQGIHRSVIASLKFSRYLRKSGFDWAIILHPTNRVNVITFLSGIPVRIGWDYKSGFLLSKKLRYSKYKGQKHELEYNLDIIRAAGIEIVDKKPCFYLREPELSRIDELLKESNVFANDRLIVFHPAASCVSKRWPIDNFLKLTGMLDSLPGIKIVVVTGRAESVYADELMSKRPDLIDLRGKLTISELGALLKRSSLLISNDSGPVHLAASIGIPVISLFSRNDPGLSPERWRPLGENSYYLHKKTDCSLCKAHNCGRGFLCLRKITPEEVFDLALSILRNSGDRQTEAKC